MLKVILHGCNGRMGRVLQKMIASSDNITVVAGIDRESETNNEFPIYNDLNSNSNKKIFLTLKFSLTFCFNQIIAEIN